MADGAAAPLAPEPCGDARDAGALAAPARRAAPPQAVLRGEIVADD